MTEQKPTAEEIKRLIDLRNETISSRVLSIDEIKELNALEIKCRPYNFFSILLDEIEALQKAVKIQDKALDDIYQQNDLEGWYVQIEDFIIKAKREVKQIMGEK